MRFPMHSKSLVTGIVIGTTLSGIGTGFAEGNNVSATIENWIQFKFNGVSQSLPSDYSILNYKGRIYVPARYIAEQLGADVSWDESTQTISVNSNLQQQLEEKQNIIDQLTKQLNTLKNPSPSKNVLKGQGNTSTIYQFEDLQSTFTTDNENKKTLIVEGKIRNISLASRRPLRITVILYNANNIAVGSGVTNYTYTLGPNETESFIVTISNPSNDADHYLVQVE